MNDEIKVSRLTKIYRTSKGDTPVRAVDDIDFAVYKGEVFGFLGPNGAGKTTTINMLTGLARPDAGIIQIDGSDIDIHASGPVYNLTDTDLSV